MFTSIRLLQKFGVISALLALFLLAPGITVAQEEETLQAPDEVVEEAETEPDFQEKLDTWFAENINHYLDKALFFPIYSVEIEGQEEPVELPLIVTVLLLGGLFFTFRYGFINVRLFTHAIQVIRGKFDKPHHEGEVTHFQALTSAL